jgi:hypothetical protein
MKPGVTFKAASGEVYEPPVCDDLFAPVLAPASSRGALSPIGLRIAGHDDHPY